MKITINYCNNLHFKAKTRDFDNIQIDEPESFHGTDLGPSPVEYLLIGIGGCLSSTFVYCLQKRNIKIDDLETIIDGDLKHNQPSLYLRLKQIQVEFNLSLKAGYNEDELDKCINEFTKYCPIYEPVLNGIPININFKKKIK
ncbi:MAG: OsmC family protein [Candidatus Lokiarchaeota archaeon]|nr:OsmC family protein [Candidatus Lokiarchaeota archaeon]